MSEAMGKILGMVMAYGVSSLGLFLAYVNYRRRIVGADKIMTSRAWLVLAAVFLAVAGGVGVVTQLAEIPAGGDSEVVESETALPVEAEPPTQQEADPPNGKERPQWPLIGILIPASIFLFATWVTSALHRHFSTHGHSGEAAGSE